MAAMVLNSPRAVEMSVYVVRAFVQLREFDDRDGRIQGWRKESKSSKARVFHRETRRSGPLARLFFAACE
jgi:hypothetical protein